MLYEHTQKEGLFPSQHYTYRRKNSYKTVTFVMRKTEEKKIKLAKTNEFEKNEFKGESIILH